MEEYSYFLNGIHYYQLNVNLNLVCANLDYMNFVGCGNEDLLNKSIFDLKIYGYNKDLVPLHKEYLKMVCDQGTPGIFEEAYKLPNETDSFIYISKKTPIFRDNRLVGIEVISIEKNSLNLEDKVVLKSLMNNLDAHIYWKNSEGVYMRCNDKQAIKLGYQSGNEVVGKTDFELGWSKETAEEFRRNDKQIMRTKKSLIKEESATINGLKRIMFSIKAPVMKNNQCIGVLGISIDVTDKKKMAEELKNKNKELEKALKIAQKANDDREKTLHLYKQFVEDQEHDIRTPLGNVASCSKFVFDELNNSKEMNEELMFLLEGVKTSSREILDYQESLLFELYQGRLSEETLFTRFNLPDIVKRAFNVNMVSARYKKLEYDYDYDESIPKYLVGDGKRIYQCLVDLLSNAVRFTHQGEVKLSVECLKEDTKIATIRFSIKDTGIGIPEDSQDDILKAFVKAKPSNKGGDRGRGLGLTRVNQYVNDMEGEMRFVSKENEGSCFKVVLPFKISLDQTKSD